MNKFWIVARHEFMSNIKKPSFLMSAIGGPILTLVLVLVVTFISATSAGEGEVEGKHVGYIDEAQILKAAVDLPEGWQAFPDETSAQAALTAKEIDSYFVLPADYIKKGDVQLYAYGGVPDELKRAIRGFLTVNIVEQIESEIAPERLIDPVNATIFMENTQRELGDSVGGVMGVFMTPILFIVVFMVALQLTSTLLMSGVVEEKSNRIMEVLVTSITPMQLLIGKIVGLGGLGLVQVGLWLGMGAAALRVGSQTEFLSSVVIPPDLVLVGVIYFFLNYFLYASLFAGIGSVIEGEQESRQYAGFVSLFSSLPMFALVAFMTDANGALPIALTLFPMTSATSVILRMSFTVVPAEQILLSMGIMLLTTLVIMWASAKVFRWALLLYGKPASPRELWRVVRGNVEIGTTSAHSRQES